MADEPDQQPRELSTSILLELFGGVSGLVDSSVPTLVFIVVNLFASLNASIVAAVVAGGAVVVLRQLRGESLKQALNGFGGLVLAVLVVRTTGSGKGIFLPGILLTAGSGVAFALSMLVKRPAIALALESIDPRYRVWRTHPELRRACFLATGVWAASFFVRAGVATAVYLAVGDGGTDNVIVYVVINAVKWPLIIGSALFTVAQVKRVEVP